MLTYPIQSCGKLKARPKLVIRHITKSVDGSNFLVIP